ncbi:MAG: hypothetical protein WC637_11680 [Victivallales bacterium]
MNDGKENTFELIRLARLEKIKLDVAIRRIKYLELERIEADNAGRLLDVDAVVKAMNEIYGNKAIDRIECAHCKTDMINKLGLTEN